MEIKPLSLSGVGIGVVQIAAYDYAFGRLNLGYQRGTWPTRLRETYVGTVPIAYFNVKGVIFYTDLTQNFKELATITSFALARQFVVQYSTELAESLFGVFEEIPVLVGARQVGAGAEIGAELGVVELEAL